MSEIRFPRKRPFSSQGGAAASVPEEAAGGVAAQVPPSFLDRIGVVGKLTTNIDSYFQSAYEPYEGVGWAQDG